MTNPNNGLYELYIEELRGIPIEQYSEQIVFEDNSNRNTNNSTINSAYINAMQGITEAMELARNGLGNINETLPDYLMSNNMVYYDNTPRTTYTRPKTQTVQYRNVGYSQPISSQNRVDYINKPNTTGYVKFNNLPRSNQEITMEVKKKPPLKQEIDYKAREEKLNPYANEESQIRNRAKKYPLLDNTIRQQNVNYNYQEPRKPLMGDSDYVPVNLYQKEQDMKFERLKQAIIKRDLEKAIEMKRQADILYGSDEEYYRKFPKKEYLQNIVTNQDIKKDIKSMEYDDIKKLARTDNDRNFFTALEQVFGSEGKYVNNPADNGGPTNLGVTQITYNDYCRRNKMPIKNVRQLSKYEVIQVYYKDFWVRFGLDKEKDPIKSLILFDTAVLHGVGGARGLYKKSNGNLHKLLDFRREHYKNKAEKEKDQKQFEQGWYNRIDRLENILNRYEEINKKQKKN